MDWFLLLVAFSLAVFMGAAAASLFARVRPHWSERRRLLASAFLLPALTLMATLAMVMAVMSRGGGEGPTMQDLAVVAVARLGALVVVLAFAGGLIGAALRQRGMRR